MAERAIAAAGENLSGAFRQPNEGKDGLAVAFHFLVRFQARFGGGILDPAVSEWAGWVPGTLLTGILGLVAVGTVGTAVFRTVWIAKRLS